MYHLLKKMNNFDNLIIDKIMCFLPYYYVRDKIKNLSPIWYKRLIFTNICGIKRCDMNYKSWYKIFYHKDHHILIRYEHKLTKQLILTKTNEEIHKIHMLNIQFCHNKTFMNYSYF